MTASSRYSDLELFEVSTDQPSRLPVHLRAQIERTWGGLPVQMYALADLDGALEFSETWVALGSRHVAVVRATEGETGPIIEHFERSEITAIASERGLSCHTIRILGGNDAPPLAVLRFTRRQRRGMEALAFVLEQALEGREVPQGADADETYVENVVRPIRDAQALVVRHQLAVVWRLLSYLKPYKKDVILGMGSAFAITVLALVPPFLVGHLVDDVIGPVQAGDVEASQVSRIAWLAVAGIALTYVLRQIAVWVRLRWMAMLGEYVARDLRTHLYEHLHKLSLSFYSRKKTGSLITRVSADTDRLGEVLAFGVVEVSLSLVMLLGLGTVLIYLDWRLGLVMTLPVPFLCWAIHLHGQHMQGLFLRAWRKWSRVTDVLSDTIPGMRVVKAFHQEEREKERFGFRNYDVVGEFNRIHASWTTFWPFLIFGVQVTIITAWCFALPRLLGESSLGPPLSMGTFVSFLLYMTMLVQPIEIIGQMARIMNRATSSAHRVFEVLDTEPEVVDLEEAVKLDPVEGRIQFQDVSFSYDGVRQVLKGVSFDVQAGELIGLVGPSGGGKTTLANLLARFYDVTSGAVLIDGHDIRELDSGDYRLQVGMVLQDPYLFHGTIVENVRYGMPDATLDDVVEATRAANAHDFVCDLPHGYDTIIGERGHTLSGGERQRISIARAILKDPRILILDEATSSVDTETERKIQQAMDRLVAGRTVLAIAHRLSTLHKADRLFVIENGKLAECGTHSELLARPDGVYRRLYQLQQEVHDAA